MCTAVITRMKMAGVHTVIIVKESCIINLACALCMNCALPSLDEDWFSSHRITVYVAHNEEGFFPNYHLVSISKIMLCLTASFSQWTLDLHSVCPWWAMSLWFWSHGDRHGTGPSGYIFFIYIICSWCVLVIIFRVLLLFLIIYRFGFLKYFHCRLFAVHCLLTACSIESMPHKNRTR
jgi:hypothetical protein